ncbi:enoyl-CoA hydratase-related protein [Jatrophihabitans telluris]|uniref:Enoyl-CoA hydratase-related protein n=1 Tax=Jatrophihabitans telluris TaxID=2038343 RepID=A0ABY4R1F0_9ACTN|nr:enoyl-CoA hydratase-related protein [Jatrophihabitans telluris]UQX89748.1 enoyl-CoA hydratase-related protein [Jatrophihabitans telluris]
MNAVASSIDFVVTDGVGTITLNRPAKLNSVTTAMSADLLELVARVGTGGLPSEVRVLVVTGAGERAFSVGSDINEVDQYPDPWRFRNRRDYCDALRSLRIPVIAAVNGYAYGGGLELALSADIRLASTTASFAAAEIKLGWIGGGGVSALLSRSVSASDAALLLLTGDPVPASEALRMGLVSRLYEPGDLLAAAHELAASIATRPTIAAQAAKANLHAAASMGQEAAIQYEREMQAICMGTDDAAEGRLAFAEKRAPQFTGR